ncbi:hypothetical protein ACIHEJ_28465 [Streptomyces sp. NPDC052301]|uniref:hypothetical protein n=1 Tax=Streptomyces sp. NPDC052301 TaxID=3365687 RepID=UPI0037CF54BF
MHTAVRSGRIAAEVPADIRVERSRRPGRGDCSTDAALWLARPGPLTEAGRLVLRNGPHLLGFAAPERM